eukprot:2220387-Pleurochrysis_carterae.AAC.1
MTHVEKELLYVPGKTHVKKVCATLNQAHTLEIGSTQLLETDDGHTATSPTAPSRCRPSTLLSCFPMATPTAI